MDISILTDLRDIEIDTKAPVSKKLEASAAQTDNVYVNRIGDYVVKVRLADTFIRKIYVYKDKRVEITWNFEENGICL